MTRLVEWRGTAPHLGEAVVAIGVFDGVHIGHRALIADAVDEARRLGVSSAVITFDRDPEQIVTPDEPSIQLLPLDEKLALIEGIGPDILLLVPFDEELAEMTPSQFLTELLLASLTPRVVAVGYDFRFGAGAAGDVRTLTRFGEAHGFEVRPHELVRTPDGSPVTSTRVRDLVLSGDVALAAQLLGRPHRVRGVVVHGRAAGAALGTPTANIATQEHSPLPADGVYAGRVKLGGHAYAAGVSVGAPPTFPDALPALEAHLIGFEGDLYGHEVEIEFLARLREQRAFASPEALAHAIHADLTRVTEIID